MLQYGLYHCVLHVGHKKQFLIDFISNRKRLTMELQLKEETIRRLEEAKANLIQEYDRKIDTLQVFLY